jgi:outer membrane protein OmpA-like peptidoglycan-associated protein
MKYVKLSVVIIVSCTLLVSSCSSVNNTKKSATTGIVANVSTGPIAGKVSNNPAMATISGAAIGGSAGALINLKMDKQAEEIKNAVNDAKVERVGEGIVVEFSSQVLFAFDKSNLSTGAKSSLDNMCRVLNSYPDTYIEVQGHTDSKGSKTYNQDLSEIRSNVVASYLTGRSITNNRVTIKGFGETLPKYSNTSADGRKQNRRVEFLITANEKMKTEAENEAGK